MFTLVSCETGSKKTLRRGEPYEIVLNEIAKTYSLVSVNSVIDIPEDEGLVTLWVYDKKTQTILPSNAQDIHILKKLVTEKLGFEPVESYEATYGYDFWYWETAEYDIGIITGGEFITIIALSVNKE